jgi:DNA repair exonuclease SbcCD ATPase subunit
MQLPDGTVLMHAPHTSYDPRKAHEYYMRTRQLKGRKKGTATPLPSSKPTKVDPQVVAKQRQAAAKRVNELKAKLADLNRQLKEKMAEAKKREADAKKPKTAAEKREDAKDAKKYRDKHKQQLANKAKKAADDKKTSDKPKEDTVDSLKTQISEVQGRLKTAVAKLQALNAGH